MPTNYPQELIVVLVLFSNQLQIGDGKCKPTILEGFLG
jgi:hypothetical protein